jgi:hypothetical protein
MFLMFTQPSVHCIHLSTIYFLPLHDYDLRNPALDILESWIRNMPFLPFFAIVPGRHFSNFARSFSLSTLVYTS